MEIRTVNIGTEIFESVIELGKKNSKTLGLFPEGAFQDHARKKWILAAVDDGELLGYVLFAITQSKRTIRIVQLCINDDCRGKGIAKRLLDSLRSKYELVLKGIALSCREDYTNATRLWNAYGFKAVQRVRSRSKKERYLIKWWYDFGNVDLFSVLDDSENKIQALLDANILFKLRDNASDVKTESKYLLSDWLEDSVEYFIAPETFNEILRDKNTLRASKSREYAKGFFSHARFAPESRDEILAIVETIVSGTSVNDESDRKQIAECVASGIDYFITQDEGILDVSDSLFNEFGLNVFRPTDFILAIDQLNNKSNYISTRVAGANYNYTSIKSGEVEEVALEFLNKKNGEKKHEMRTSLVEIASNVDNSEVRVVTDSLDNKVGFWCGEYDTNCFNIQLIRVKDRRIGGSLFKQMVNDVIEKSLQNGKRKVIISDSNLPDESTAALASLGFFRINGSWEKVSLNGIINFEDINTDFPEVVQQLNIDEIIKKAGSTSSDEAVDLLKFELEKMLWPIKFSGLKIPTYIIPIRPHWAEELFDSLAAKASLFGAKEELHWNNENIYYRSVKPVSEVAPGRILWYVSSQSNNPTGRVKGIVACSYLNEVHVGEAKQLFQRFKHFGIYQWDDIYKLAKNDAHAKIKALKFSSTEIFKKVIPLSLIDTVLEKNGQNKNTFASPVIVPNIIFEELYKIGKRIDEE